MPPVAMAALPPSPSPARQVVVANVGDSRAVLSRAGRAIDLSTEHRVWGKSATVLAEIERIEAVGGWVDDGRVCGVLAVSRWGCVRACAQLRTLPRCRQAEAALCGAERGAAALPLPAWGKLREACMAAARASPSAVPCVLTAACALVAPG